MSEFRTERKVFIKSHNKSSKIIGRYGYALMTFFVLTIAIYYFTGNRNLIIPLLKSLAISLTSSFVFTYIIDIIRGKYNVIDVFTKNYIHIGAIIIALFGINMPILLIIGAALVSVLAASLLNYMTSSALFGILLIILYRYYIGDIVTPLENFKNIAFTGDIDTIIKSFGTIPSYLWGVIYLSPILSIAGFLYLFYRKSIKYSVVISYILTFSIMMFIYGLFNKMIWLPLFELVCGNILFLGTFTLSEYIKTPTLNESQVIYGIILGILSVILRFVIPELSVIIPILIGPFILTRYLERISPKLKYNNKTYYLALTILFIIGIVSTIGLIILF